MKGDFSKKPAKTAPNDLAVLFQQGRVISDRDLTEAEMIAEAWRGQAARDVIGAGVAAVPAGEADGYRVTSARVIGNEAEIRIQPGRIWADGLPLVLEPNSGGIALLRASYYAPPLNPAGTLPGSITDGSRDAVILEVETGALSAFQDPARLIEPALGGPDTSARLHASQRLRLLRLGQGETCTTIQPRLRDDPASRGRLSARLEPPTVTAGDCPVADGGGYSGFEHNLWRIEIAETSGTAVKFRWSNQNGGLVGRGRFTGGADPEVVITANRAAILQSGIESFYLEALDFVAAQGEWRVVYGAQCSLTAEGNLQLLTPAQFGTMPGSSGTAFFRLWNGIEPISGFTGGPKPFRDGIELDFTSAASAYRPGDYWSFDLRAGGISNPQVMFQNAPPEGPRLIRVPLAIITWTGAANTEAGGTIADCRRRFRPLSNQKICCTWLVGNGVDTFGDFNSLEEAVAHLPAEGGKICLLPGIHQANLVLTNRHDIRIHGCPGRSHLIPRENAHDQPVIHIEGGYGIEIADLDFITLFGSAITANGSRNAPLETLTIRGCRIVARRRGLDLDRMRHARIEDNRIAMADHPDARAAIRLRGDDCRITGNSLTIWHGTIDDPAGGGSSGGGGGGSTGVADPCLQPGAVYGMIVIWVVIIVDLWNSGHSAPHPDPYKGAGGLHLRGGSNRVDVSGNQITGGASHGITLGGAFAGEAEASDGTDAAPAATAPPVTVSTSGTEAGRAVDEAGQPVAALALKLVSATGATVYTTVTTGTGRFVFVTPGGTYTLVAADGFAVDSVGYDEQKLILVKLRRVTPVTGPDQEPLSEIRILRNDILGMDLCGIGFPLTTSEAARPLMPHSASVASLAGWLSDLIAPYELVATTSLLRDLEIRENRISGNLRVPVTREWRKAVTRIAPAGICLPLVEGVVIAANRITGNGFDASYPAAGLFIGYGEAIAITDNHIEENGILSEAYDYEAVEGLRGGVIIRMASARVTGGRDDQPARPAVDLRDNHIDQPVGRAITICAYGPVSCIGNHLNSEREGRMGLADRAIGGVLIANLGGLHRHFYTRQKGGFNVRNEAAGGVLGALVAQSAVEGVLPGGEVMFSANRVRTGGGHRSLLSQLIVTCDDISYNGNQATMLGSNVTFGNLVAAGMTLRVTDNRFRETAEMVVLSALSRCFSLAGGALPYPMNATAQNQADHCIFALGEDSSSAPPVISAPNQVVFSQSCPTHPAEQMAYLREAMRYLLFAELSTGGPRDTGDGDGRVIVTEAVQSSARFQEALVFDKAGALERARREASADAAILLRRESELLARRLAADLAEEQSRLARIVPAPEPAPGARLIEGRVTDTTGRAVAGAAVQLVDATGRALGITARADQAGYYALELSGDQAAKLALRSGVAISISTEAVVGKAQLVPLGTLLTSKEARLRADLATEHLAAFRPTLTGAKFSRAEGGTPDLKPDLKPEQPEEKPLDPGPALTDVKGIGAALADKLRLAGIGDAKALLAASDAKLTGILGSKAATLRDSAREAIALALKQRKGG